MAGKFVLKRFADINIDDPFFDSLKADYPGTPYSSGFVGWFQKKANAGKHAMVFEDDEGLGAFVCIKSENEKIRLQDKYLPEIQRLKISTLRIAERYRGQRLGEGALGLVLWKWQRLGYEEVYITTFEKQDVLIAQLEKFGFVLAGHNMDGECVYIKSRKAIKYSDPYEAFPFINPSFQGGGYLIIEDYYHDTMFPYSELKNTLQEAVALNVANGLSKIYVGAQPSVPYKRGEPIFIYRKYNGDGPKRYKSCLTSFCVITNIIHAKGKNKPLVSFGELLARISNKSVFDENELWVKYNNQINMFVIEMLYNGYFGGGHNVNMDWLDNNGLWSQNKIYPAQRRLSPEECKRILKEGNINVDNVIID